uniref:Uncharacterized protein n=1 Tax=Triticum urartu TaxID=4572 RepID=A0A8R7PE58_TRIUA
MITRQGGSCSIGSEDVWCRIGAASTLPRPTALSLTAIRATSLLASRATTSSPTCRKRTLQTGRRNNETSLRRLRPDLLGIHGCNAYMWRETGREAWDWICNYAFEKRASPHQNSFVVRSS